MSLQLLPVTILITPVFGIRPDTGCICNHVRDKSLVVAAGVEMRPGANGVHGDVFSPVSFLLSRECGVLAIIAGSCNAEKRSFEDAESISRYGLLATQSFHVTLSPWLFQGIMRYNEGI